MDHNKPELVDILVKYGARIDIEDDTGLNPVDAAAVLEKPQILEVLLRYEKLQKTEDDHSSFIYHERTQN